MTGNGLRSMGAEFTSFTSNLFTLKQEEFTADTLYIDVAGVGCSG